MSASIIVDKAVSIHDVIILLIVWRIDIDDIDTVLIKTVQYFQGMIVVPFNENVVFTVIDDRFCFIQDQGRNS